MKPDIVFVIATYNEAGNISQLLSRLSDYRVIVVDDNSPDGTGRIAQEYQNVSLITRASKYGIASAYVEGFRAAFKFSPRYIIQMDAGLTHDPHDAKNLVEAAEAKNADLVIGSRFIEKHKWMGFRTLLSRTAAFFSTFLELHQSDVTSGYRCWRAGFLNDLLDYGPIMSSKGFSFQLELLYNACQRGARISECPIPYRLTNSSLNKRIIFEYATVFLRLLKENTIKQLN